MVNKFQVNDRVIVKDENSKYYDKKGTIVDFDFQADIIGRHQKVFYQINFDDIDTSLDDNKGWIAQEYLEEVLEEEVTEEEEVEVEVDPSFLIVFQQLEAEKIKYLLSIGFTKTQLLESYEELIEEFLK